MNLETLIISIAPQWTGYAIAIYALWRISTNALHGVAKTNQEIVKTQTEIVLTLQAIRTEIRDHSDSDAKTFTVIQESLGKQIESLIRLEDRTR